jgi:hypothetical protein
MAVKFVLGWSGERHFEAVADHPIGFELPGKCLAKASAGMDAEEIPPTWVRPMTKENGNRYLVGTFFELRFNNPLSEPARAALLDRVASELIQAGYACLPAS